MTTFKIYREDSEKDSFEFSYKAWWSERSEIEITPLAASAETENEEEDIFGYIYSCKYDPEGMQRMMQLWSEYI